MVPRKSVLRKTLLQGGAKPRTVTLKRNNIFSASRKTFETNRIYNTSVIVHGKNGRSKTLQLLEKTFRPPVNPRYNHSVTLRSPVNQLRAVKGLRELNREQKLGLNILPTVRLRKTTRGKHTLLITKLNEIKYNSLSAKEKEEVDAQLTHAKKALSEFGYSTARDIFLIEKESKTGKVKVWIADLGTLEEAEEEY